MNATWTKESAELGDKIAEKYLVDNFEYWDSHYKVDMTLKEYKNQLGSIIFDIE